MGFLDELVRYKPRRRRRNPSSPYPVYIDGVQVGEFVLPWWVKVGVAVGVIGGAILIYERVRRR